MTPQLLAASVLLIISYLLPKGKWENEKRIKIGKREYKEVVMSNIENGISKTPLLAKKRAEQSLL